MNEPNKMIHPDELGEDASLIQKISWNLRAIKRNKYHPKPSNEKLDQRVVKSADDSGFRLYQVQGDGPFLYLMGCYRESKSAGDFLEGYCSSNVESFKDMYFAEGMDEEGIPFDQCQFEYDANCFRQAYGADFMGLDRKESFETQQRAFGIMRGYLLNKLFSEDDPEIDDLAEKAELAGSLRTNLIDALEIRQRDVLQVNEAFRRGKEKGVNAFYFMNPWHVASPILQEVMQEEGINYLSFVSLEK